MFSLVNQSPYAAVLVPSLDADGGEAVGVAVKGTYTLPANAAPLLAKDQPPPGLADVYWGEPGKSSLRYASDLVPEKRGTDVVLIGSAYAPAAEAGEVDVTLEAGPLLKTVRVLGARRWA